jgi:two-component system nitrate/nitrite response regulator NarL
MTISVGTVVILPNAIARAGIASLLEKYCYRVLASAPNAQQLLGARLSDRPRLVLLGNGAVDMLLPQVIACRHEWPGCKIVLLHECSSVEEHSLIMSSSANACVPLSVSHETLVGLLNVVASEDSDVFILLGCRQAVPDRLVGDGNAYQNHSSGNQSAPPVASDWSGEPRNGNGSVCNSEPKRDKPKLSDRELQILHGIVRGLQNKMIARECGITEATVKVHMKSILRKIRVGNRTQAAIWAMEHDPTVIESLEDRVFATNSADHALPEH